MVCAADEELTVALDAPREAVVELAVGFVRVMNLNLKRTASHGQRTRRVLWITRAQKPAIGPKTEKTGSYPQAIHIAPIENGRKQRWVEPGEQ